MECPRRLILLIINERIGFCKKNNIRFCYDRHKKLLLYKSTEV